MLGRLAPSVAVALLVLPGCGSDDPEANPYEAAAEACVDKINTFRATLDLPAYVRWSTEESCAGQEAAMDAASDTAHGAFGTCMESAQDECPAWPGPAESMIDGCLTRMWDEGPGADFATHGHYINMSSTMYTKVACGFATLADGSVWATQNFQ
jgi:hypothetical protein